MRHVTTLLFLQNLARSFAFASIFLAFIGASFQSVSTLPRKRDEQNAHNETRNQGFELYISRDEMNRTLGVLAEMNYVSNGIVSAYSTKFPYRISANVSHVLFTWFTHIHYKKVKYSIRAVVDNFNIVPVVHIQREGFLPVQPQTFAVEYRCAGSRSGQFHVHLHFNVSWPSEHEFTEFTLMQEKICTSNDGRRGIFGSNGDASSRISVNWPLNINQIVLLIAAIFGALILLCVILACVYVNSSRKNTAHGGSALAPMTGAGGAAHSFYTAAAMLGKSGFHDQISTTTNFCATTTASTRMSISLTSAKPAVHQENVFTKSLLSDSEDDGIRPQPLTSTPYTNTKMQKLPKFGAVAHSSDKPKIIFERHGNLVDISLALIELNADRNLFVVMPHVELEGTFGEIRWTNWRQTGIMISGDIDDEEDDVNEDTALICKTLKQNTDRNHFEIFLREALMLHNVPAHPNLAQVVAAATFGNFNNPDSVKDFPLICYKHSGFGILKKFLCACRGLNGFIKTAQPLSASSNNNMVAAHSSISAAANIIEKNVSHQTLLNPTLRVHDLVSAAVQVIKAVQHLHTFGIIHKDIATRNCLISEFSVNMSSSVERLHVQLADNALSKDVFPEEYANITVFNKDNVPVEGKNVASTSKSALLSDKRTEKSIRTELLPVKWMAPESIRNKIFNSSTDVWTLGIFMWELFTCGQLPFADVQTTDVQMAIASGARPAHPQFNCPNEMYDIMFSCWNHDPLQRPSTEQLLRVIGDFMHQLRKYI